MLKGWLVFFFFLLLFIHFVFLMCVISPCSP
jgi:hypothetical protein